jgi:hypothetical protein
MIDIVFDFLSFSCLVASTAFSCKKFLVFDATARSPIVTRYRLTVLVVVKVNYVDA